VSFSTTMTEGFQKVVDKLQELIAKIPDLAASFASIPAINVPVNYSYNIPPPPDFSQYGQVPGASTGGIVVPSGIEHFAGGGMVGEDNRIIAAKDGEVVLNDSQQKNLLGLASGRGSSADWRAMAAEQRATRRTLEEHTAILRRLPADLTSAMLTAPRGRR
jgi:hypothetical protein